MEAIAKYDFKATADDELSFKRGDILKVSGGEGLGVRALALGFSAPQSGESLPVPLLSPQRLPAPFNRVPKRFLEPSLTSLKAGDVVLLLC
uniref:SH3 domain-containing protein n=1 Tax=Anser brachyrhynchus TaxID=132585 RepID=A0A8B9CGS2_9AVES